MSNTQNTEGVIKGKETNYASNGGRSAALVEKEELRRTGSLLKSEREQHQMETGKFSSYQEAASFFKKFT
ncbi:MAG: hypothetical protein AAGF54_02660 [Pseudomonadota bacterium]